MTRRLAAWTLPLALLAAGPAWAVSNALVTRPAPDRLVVTWTDADPVDVALAEKPDAGFTAGRPVASANRAGRVEIPVAPDARPFILLRDGGDGRVTRVAERVLPLAQGSNFRDLGGYPAADGKTVRWGMIYRSGATPMLTKADMAMISGLGLKEMVDLRSSEERTLAPSKIEGVPYTAVGYSMMRMMGDRTAPISGDEQMHAVYRQMPTLLAPQLRLVFGELLEGGGAVAYNCSAGQDRTGFTSALVLSALGVPRATIVEDYHLSTTYRRPEFEMPIFDAAAQAANPVAKMFAGYQADPQLKTPQPLRDGQGRSLLDFALAEVETRYGSIEAYLDKELGVDAADIAKLRAMYLE
jgi:protein-tyrosine phosphatase